MAFKMNPKSPLLMKAMGYASPAKQTMKSGSSMTAAEKKAMSDKSVFGPDGKNVAKPPKSKSKSKYDKSPAKQTAKQKANLPKEVVNAIAAKQGKSPAKQAKITDAMYKKRDMKLYGNLDKAEFDKEANRQINVRNKRFKNATEMSKANSGGKQTKTDYSGGQTKDGSCSREDDACNTKGQSIRKRDIGYDVPKRQMQSAGTTLKADKIKTSEPKGNLAGAKEIKVTKKVTKVKPTRSQKIRAKGEAALASGNTDKAQRLRRRMDRVDARKAKRAARKAARA